MIEANYSTIGTVRKASLIMSRGIPASGKSTWAEEFIKNRKNYVRLNRDLLREMLHFNVWSPVNEDLTVDALQSLAKLYTSKGVNVIIDDTNLTKKHEDKWRGFCQANGVNFGIRDHNTPVEECLRRNENRAKKVPPHVITNMALQAGMVNGPFLLCDLDGTLCDIDHRVKFVKDLPEGQKKDWKSFFDGIKDDTPRCHVREIVKSYVNRGIVPIAVSARPENYRKETQEWLDKHIGPHFKFFTLIMRGKGDSREDSIVKRELLHKHFPTEERRKQIVRVIDDRPRVIRMWKEEGLDVIDVGNQEEF